MNNLTGNSQDSQLISLITKAIDNKHVYFGVVHLSPAVFVFLNFENYISIILLSVQAVSVDRRDFTHNAS